jgi:hypothetical protein
MFAHGHYCYLIRFKKITEIIVQYYHMKIVIFVESFKISQL